MSAKRVRLDQDGVWVDFSNGSTICVPLQWFPRLMESSGRGEQLTISSTGFHLEIPEGDVSIVTLLAGLGGLSASNKTIAG